MSTLGEIVTRILQNCGKGSAGEDREAVLADLRDILCNDVPVLGGAPFAQGTVSVPIGGTAAFKADGIYDFPATLRTADVALQFVDDPGLGTSFTVIDGSFVYSDPAAFYAQWKKGDAVTDADYAKPVAVLIHGRKLHVRPIPNQSAVAAPWWGTLVIAGTVNPDIDTLTEDSDVPDRQTEAFLIAQGTVLEAGRRGDDGVLSLWGPILELRRQSLADIAITQWRRPQPARDF